MEICHKLFSFILRKEQKPLIYIEKKTYVPLLNEKGRKNIGLVSAMFNDWAAMYRHYSLKGQVSIRGAGVYNAFLWLTKPYFPIFWQSVYMTTTGPPLAPLPPSL